jgi:formylglycine-generating enzyme required for sulfatase activity
MAGNVWEWTADVHGLWQAKAKPGETFRVMRSGAWNCIPALCQTSYRDGREESSTLRTLGFRVARSAD